MEYIIDFLSELGLYLKLNLTILNEFILYRIKTPQRRRTTKINLPPPLPSDGIEVVISNLLNWLLKAGVL